jgi:hypothetical protein
MEPWMKLSTKAVAGVFSLFLALEACTVRGVTPEDGPTSDGVGDAPRKDASSASDPDSGAADSSAAADPSGVPAELAATSWIWVTTSGAHRLTFTKSTYTSDVFLDGHPGESCGTEYFTRRSGTVTSTGGSITLSSNGSTRRKENSCTAAVLSDEPIEDEVVTYEWRLEHDESGGDGLVLTRSDGSETRYAVDEGS